MANRKLTELPTLSPINFDSTDLLYIVDTETDASKKITYANLVGNTITTINTTITAFSAENVGDILFLSGGIDTNAASIASITSTSTENNTKIDAISAVVDTNFGLFELLSSEVRDLDITTITSEIDTLCGYVKNLNTETDDLYITKHYADKAYNYTTTVSGFNLDKVNTQVGLISGVGLNSNTAATTTGDMSATHFFPVVFNGVTYKMLLAES